MVQTTLPQTAALRLIKGAQLTFKAMAFSGAVPEMQDFDQILILMKAVINLYR